MENYEQKYKEMKKRVLAIGQGYVKEVDYNSPRSIAEYIDPELRESKDERIRKELIQYLKDYPNLPNGNYCRNDFFSWLEKQCSKVDVLDDFPTEFERQISHLIASSINKEWEYKKDFVKYTANALLQYAKNELEKQGEQKPTPKFKIGDTIHKIGESTVFPRTIEKIEDGDYVCNNSHSFVNIKFQDDYELVEQKPAWSEEDLNKLANYLHNNGHIIFSDAKQKAYEISLLLRKQNSWKPNKEQMDTLKYACGGNYVDLGILESLYNDLKNL